MAIARMVICVLAAAIIVFLLRMFGLLDYAFPAVQGWTGIALSYGTVALWLIVGIVVLSLGLMLWNLIGMKQKRYDLYDNGVEIFGDVNFTSSQQFIIPYENIVQIIGEKDKEWLSQKFNMGKVSLKLSGMAKEEFVMEDMKDPQGMAAELQRYAVEWKNRSSALNAEGARLGKILSRMDK